MPTVIQVSQYSLSVADPNSLNATQITYVANGESRTLSLTNESIREKTTQAKAEIAQTQQQIAAAETSANQAQQNLNQATAQLTQLVQQRPTYSRNTSYYDSRKLEEEYQKKVQAAKIAVETATKSLEQARVTKQSYQNELNKQNTELAVLQDVAGKLPSLQQAALDTQLTASKQLQKTQDANTASTQQAASTLENNARSSLLTDPRIGVDSDAYLAAEDILSADEEQRLRTDAANQLETLSLKKSTTLNTTVETKISGQTINVIDNTNGQESELTKEANKKTEEEVNLEPAHVPRKLPTENPLHQYVNYTYGFSLFALSKDDYNSLTSSATDFAFVAPAGQDAKRLLIASAGRREIFGAVRNNNFEEDFYFDSFKIETVVGLNARGRGTNVTEAQFGVIEPMGFTLFNRLLKTAEELKIPNYLEMPLLLRLDFYGSTDVGAIVAPIANQTKILAVKLVECKTSITTRGTEYQFRAVPYHQQAFNETYATTPVNFSITASTVGEFFDADKPEINGINKIALDSDREQRQAITDAYNRNDEKSAEQLAQSKAKKFFVVKSYAAGFNSWLAYLKETGATQKLSEVAFQFHKDFRDSAIILPNVQKVENAPVSGTAAQAANPCADRTVTQAISFPINAGTDVLKVIELVMQNSEFIRKQVIDVKNDSPEAMARKRASPMYWYKVHGSVELLDFDESLNKWSKKITYIVDKYEVLNVKLPYGAAAKPNGVVKEYNYWYTGKNKDVIDLRLDFNMGFFIPLLVARNRTAEAGNKAVEVDPSASKDIVKPSSAAGSPQPQQIFTTGLNQRAMSAGDAQKDAVGLTVANLAQNIYSESRGDMINVQLRILGDPEFIKQDDLYYPASGFTFDYSRQFVNANKSGNHRQGIYSLNFDSGDVLVGLNFQTPTDIDEQTGMPKMDSRFQTGIFSGVYKVINVTSEFRNGKFEQTLNLVRLFDQDEQTTPAQRQTAQDDGSYSQKELARAKATSPNPAIQDDGSYAQKELARAKATSPNVTIIDDSYAKKEAARAVATQLATQNTATQQRLTDSIQNTILPTLSQSNDNITSTLTPAELARLKRAADAN